MCVRSAKFETGWRKRYGGTDAGTDVGTDKSGKSPMFTGIVTLGTDKMGVV